MDILNYFKKEGRALPVFLLVDVSGSMRGEKIETVNVALKEMLNSFKKIENPKGIVKLCIATFGNSKVDVIKEMSVIKDDEHFELSADGNTPMGQAFESVVDMIEKHYEQSSRDYTSTIVLISDGNPTDFAGYNANVSQDEIIAWPALSRLHSDKYTANATKLAMGIGDDVDVRILKGFTNNDSIPVIKAKDNQTISKFFEWVTISVSVRSVSINPNQVVLEDTYIFDNDEMEF